MAKAKKKTAEELAGEVTNAAGAEEPKKKKSIEDMIVSGATWMLKPKQIIQISPAIDIALRGGVPEGSVCIFTGPPKCGKTTTALKLAANAQKAQYAVNGEVRKVFVYNVEGRLKPRDLEAAGIDLNNAYIVESTTGNILSGEDFLEIAVIKIKENPYSIHIVDSFSQLCTTEEIAGGMNKMQRADGAKLLKKFFRIVCNDVPVNNCIVIGITHIMGNPSGMGGDGEGGGYGAKYSADVKLRCSHVQRWTVGADEESEQIGQKVFWRVESSALGPTGVKFMSYLRYGSSLDEEIELIEMCGDIDIIKKGGAWYTVEIDGEEKKVQGKENLKEFLKANPAVAAKYKKELYDMFGVKQ